MFYNATTGELELDYTDRMKKYVGVEVKAADGTIGKIVDAYSCYDGDFYRVCFNDSKILSVRDDSDYIQEAIEKSLINFKHYSCVLVKHSQNYDKPIKDDVLIYDENINLITTVSRITNCNDWFAANLYKKENEDTLIIDTFSGMIYKIDMNSLEVTGKRFTK